MNQHLPFDSRCAHPNIELINPYELIRKYRCLDCGLIMMCSCDKYVGENFLSHQIETTGGGHPFSRIIVDGGFQDTICEACRGRKLTAYPKRELYGATSKFQRYYWREIQLDIIKEFGNFCLSKGDADWIMAQGKYQDEYAEIRKRISDHYKKIHETNSLYVYSEKSQEDVIKEYCVDKLEVKATYVPSKGKSSILYNGVKLSVEDFVIKKFEEEGYSALKTESVPFHVLYAVFMSHVIIDPSDEHLVFMGFPDKNLLDQGLEEQDTVLWCYRPEDFGTRAYWKRRKQAIIDYIDELPTTQTGMVSHFNFMITLSGSYNLRNYLWAHKDVDAERARAILGILAPSKIKEILIYLNKDYWGHYLGWPDLLIYKEHSYCFVEVKSSKDKLSEDQKVWIARNYHELKLPYKLVKIIKG